MNMSSGTAMNPYSWQMPMLMTQAGNWNLMYMAQAFVVDTQQSGSARRRQAVFRQLVYGLGAAFKLGTRQRVFTGDGQSGSGDGHRPPLSAALSDR